jgi:hypothetical protein
MKTVLYALPILAFLTFLVIWADRFSVDLTCTDSRRKWEPIHRKSPAISFGFGPLHGASLDLCCSARPGHRHWR